MTTNSKDFGMPIEDITNENKINNLFRALPEELLDKGWKLQENTIYIPYSDNIYWTCRVNPELKEDKRKKKWIIAWKYSNEKEIYVVGEDFEGNVFINKTNPQGNKEIGNRNKVMGFITKEYELPRGLKKVREYWDLQINLLNRYKIEQLLLDNFNNQDNIEDLEENEESKKEYPETFENYHDKVQKEVIEIIENNDFLKYLLDSVSWKHQGDKNTALLLLLSIATAYISIGNRKIESVHQLLNALQGQGKTDVFNKVKEVQPDQYVVDLTSFSEKSLYYGKDYILNPYCNLLFLDDIDLSDGIIKLLKLLLDNNRKKKTHKTIIDKKFVEFDLKGVFLGLLNMANSVLNNELGDRCYLGSLEKTNPYIKNKIKQNNVIDLDNDNFNLKLKACYQYLIDKIINENLIVFNPMLLFFDVENHENRNINHYLGLSKGMTFYNYAKRTTIDNIMIGGCEDIEKTLELVSKEFEVQKHKLLNSHKLILNELENNPYNNTIKKLEGVTGYSNETVRIKIRDLELKGYIKISKEPEHQFDSTEYEFVKSYKNDSNTDSTLPILPNFIGCKEKNPLLVKKAILINFLTYLQVLLDKNIENKIHTFLKNNIYELDSYNNLCLMLKNFNNYIKKDNKIIYKNSSYYITNKEEKYSKDIVNKINVDIFILMSELRSNLEQGKTKKKILNENQSKNNFTTVEMGGGCKDKNSNKDLRKHIHKKIYEISQRYKILLKNKLFKNLSRPENIDQDNFIRIVEKELKYLEKKGFIEINETNLRITIITEFVDYYKEHLESLSYED